LIASIERVDAPREPEAERVLDADRLPDAERPPRAFDPPAREPPRDCFRFVAMYDSLSLP
jgi:hypothetical protein